MWDDKFHRVEKSKGELGNEGGVTERQIARDLANR